MKITAAQQELFSTHLATLLSSFPQRSVLSVECVSVWVLPGLCDRLTPEAYFSADPRGSTRYPDTIDGFVSGETYYVSVIRNILFVLLAIRIKYIL
jgi:hypothetical protein